MIKLRYLLLYALLLSASNQLMGRDMSQIASNIEEAMQRGEIRAAVVGSFDTGEIAIQGFGQLSKSTPTIPTGKTQFEIGSITKVFTVILVQGLVDEGKVDWSDPISMYFDPKTFASPMVASITLRELATHTSGLPRLPDNMEPSDPLDPYGDYDREDLFTFLGSYQPKELKKEHAYSNLGVGLLGFIAAKTLETDFATALKTRIFEPLGMHRSMVRSQNATLIDVADGYSHGADMPAWTFDVLAGAGAVLSTVDDLMLFVQAVVSTESNKLASAIQNTLLFESHNEYGLGWQISRTANKEKIFWHNGGTGGFASFLGVDPAASKGWVLLTTSTAYGYVTDLGMSLFLHLDTTKHDLTPYLGVFEIMPNLHLTFSERGGRLFAQAAGQPAFPLTPSATEVHQFRFEPAAIEISFDLANGEKPNKLAFTQAGQKFEGRRVGDEFGVQEHKEIDLPPKQLKQYVGSYQLQPSATITIDARGAQLYMQITGQPVIPIFPSDLDHFFLKVVDAKIEFERDNKGRVTTLVLYQNGVHRATRTN